LQTNSHYPRRYPIIFLISLIAAIQPIHGFAQFYLGVEAGLDKNYLYTNNSNQAFTQYGGYQGFSLAIPLQYRLTDWFSVEADPSYIRKNYKIVRTDFFQGIYQNNTNTYLQLPLMAHFSFGGRQLKGFLNLGGYAAYWSAGRVKGSEPNILDPVDSSFTTNQQPANDYAINHSYNYNEKYAFDSKKDRRMELGWVAGAGISYELNNSLLLFIEARYYQSLTDQQKNYMIHQTPRYNETYTGLIGVMMPLKDLFNFTGKRSSAKKRP
jgi:opacity protein-like surface antigen